MGGRSTTRRAGTHVRRVGDRRLVVEGGWAWALALRVFGRARASLGRGGRATPAAGSRRRPAVGWQQVRIAQAANRVAERRKHAGRAHPRTGRWTAACLV